MAAISPPPNIDPQSRIRNLSQLGSTVAVDNNVPPRRYLRSGLEMERMANVYLDEGNLEHAFILYTKLVTLLVEKLPKHVQYKQVPSLSKTDAKKRVLQAFQRAEDLKGVLKKRYDEEFEMWKRHEAEKKLELERQQKEEWAKEKELERKNELEKQELKRKREIEKQKIFEENEQGNQIGIGMLPPKVLPTEKNEQPTALPNQFNLHPSLPVNTYPMVPPSLNQTTTTNKNVERPPPNIDRSSKPSWLDFVSGLRTLNVPKELIRKFVDIASPNTRQNRETCGILAGKLRQNVFHITNLIIPKQTSTSDSCTTVNEEDIFVYQDFHDLITLGWIHTHPSQTAFMSSIDLHTHCSYQLMLPEALAIVCAPKHSQTGMYSLTDDYGLKFIAACKQQGFHPHPKEPPIYEESSHVRLQDSSSIIIADLR